MSDDHPFLDHGFYENQLTRLTLYMSIHVCLYLYTSVLSVGVGKLGFVICIYYEIKFLCFDNYHAGVVFG